MKSFAAIIFVICCGWLFAETTQVDVPIHDPSIIEQNGRFYIFATGPGISVAAFTVVMEVTGVSVGPTGAGVSRRIL